MISMNKHPKNKAEIALRTFFISYCFIFTGILIAFLIIGRDFERVALGTLFLLSSVFHFAEFYRNFKNPRAKYIYLGLAIIGVGLGIFTLVHYKAELWVVCLLFGLLDVLSGLFEIATSAFILKRSCKNPLELAEYVISSADILFGILLILELEKGIFVHVVFLTTVFVANGALTLTKLILDLKKHE